ncbi:glycosyltransferase [Absicoccus porci]|uniref:glycosyltransferase n=1 Tax=Absicoccus porci TaxID=2486576 RepID=UPI002A829A43|nr:glycosyltransferase [Absicoccus porci]MDY4739672.1 glycosyltransferase [Absicoccus porci]
MSIVESKNITNLVTCVILSYKSGNKIFKAIDSILNQDYPYIELIISDDGSPEFDTNRIEDYIYKYKRLNINNFIIIKHKKNMGTVRNYNDAIIKSNGKYIINLAADDRFFDISTVTNIIQAFEQNKADIVVGNAISIDTEKNINQSIKMKYLKKPDKKKLFNRLALENFISGSCTYYSKKYFDVYGLFDTDMRLIEDWPNIIKAVSMDASIYYLDRPTVYYSPGGVSTVENKSASFLNDYCNIIKKYILDNTLSTTFTKRYASYMLIRIKTNRKVPLIYNIRYIDVVLYKAIEWVKNGN